jgi:hypothetical protein
MDIQLEEENEKMEDIQKLVDMAVEDEMERSGKLQCGCNVSGGRVVIYCNFHEAHGASVKGMVHESDLNKDATMKE